jgi:ribosomal-protein-alanine N-acetyltransferase
MLAPPPEALAALDARAFAVPWPAADFARLLANRAVGAWLLRVDGVDSAYLCFQWTAEEAEVYRIAVVPEQRRRGHARLLLDRFAAWALGQQVQRIFLEVRESNLPAVQLYRSAQFAVVARRKGYYTAPPEDALIMEQVLPG